MADAYEPIGDPEGALDVPIPEEPAPADAPPVAPKATVPSPKGAKGGAKGPLRDDGINLESKKVTVSNETVAPPKKKGKRASAEVLTSKEKASVSTSKEKVASVSTSKERVSSSRASDSSMKSETGAKGNEKKGFFKQIPKLAYAPAGAFVFFGIITIAFAIESLS